MSQYHSTPEDNACHESHDKMLAYVPKPPNNPSISQHDHETRNDDTHMEDTTAEEGKATTQQRKSDPKDATAEVRQTMS